MPYLCGWYVQALDTSKFKWLLDNKKIISLIPIITNILLKDVCNTVININHALKYRYLQLVVTTTTNTTNLISYLKHHKATNWSYYQAWFNPIFTFRKSSTPNEQYCTFCSVKYIPLYSINLCLLYSINLCLSQIFQYLQLYVYM